MREIPIPFSPAMVREILAGRKTQTRRLVKPQPDGAHNGVPYWLAINHGEGRSFPVPFVPGTRLWVREAWRVPVGCDAQTPAELPTATVSGDRTRVAVPILYLADGTATAPAKGGWGRYRHGRFMVRAASRLSLRVESVRVERAQAISDDDVQREGVSEESVRALWGAAARARQGECGPDVRIVGVEWRELWRLAWTLLYGAASWSMSPWLWCVGFSPVAGERAGRAA